MTYPKLLRKPKAGFDILKEQGLLTFTITALQHVQKRRHNRGATKTNQKHQVYTKARYQDVLAVSLDHSANADWPGTARRQLRFNWVMPPPGKGSGGHLNIFRFIKYLEDAGHVCRIYLYAPGGHGPMSAVHAIMGDSYPKLKAPMHWLEEDNVMTEADGVFATSWETAYPVYRAPLKAKRFYFVQDFEPFFFPAGSLYALAENTYKFGFYGVTAGGWLAKKLKRDYGMKTGFFDFGADPSIYSFDNHKPRKEIFFYARPYTERRGFEIGVMALDLFHKKHPDYTINLAGWDVSDYDLPFPCVNHATLEISELNSLYNRCAAALVLSFTNMSLLPLELLKSGVIPVVNAGENNVLVSDNPHIAYAENNDPQSLAEALSAVVTKDKLEQYALEASRSVKTDSWEQSGKKFVNIVEKETRKNG